MVLVGALEGSPCISDYSKSSHKAMSVMKNFKHKWQVVIPGYKIINNNRYLKNFSFQGESGKSKNIWSSLRIVHVVFAIFLSGKIILLFLLSSFSIVVVNTYYYLLLAVLGTQSNVPKVMLVFNDPALTYVFKTTLICSCLVRN